MSRQLIPSTTLESLKQEAKRWLKALRADDGKARARLERADPNAPASPGLRAVQHALALEFGLAGWTAFRNRLADDLARPGSSSPEDLKALLEAAGAGDLRRVIEILESHPELLDERGGSGTRTALHCAVGGAHEAVVRCLLERGADPNVRCEGDAATPLHFAAEKEDLGLIRLLIEHGADPVGEGDYHGFEVLGWATCFGKGRKEVVDYLIAHGARHNIFSAVAMGEVESIRQLVTASRADLDRRMDLTNRRRRPLHLAVVKKQPKSLATLLELGANTEALDEAGLSPLDQAALAGEVEKVQLLLDRGAAVRLPAAFALQRAEDIERLLRADPECLKPGSRWGNLIVRASEQAPGPVVEALILAGASVNVRDDPKTAIDSTSGYTPLHAAAFHGNASAVGVLLKHGADPTIRDERYGGTPAGWADYAGHHAVRDLILQAGGSV